MKHFAPKPRLLIPPTDWMPARSPLKMPTQNLGSPFKDSAAPPLPIQPHIWLKRILIIAPATVLSVTVATMLAAQLSENGYNFLEWLWIALITATFFWISFVVCLAAAGTISTCNKLVSEPDASCLNLSKIAILVPIYNEDTAKVFSNIFGMMSDLEDKVSPLQFTFFVLSDSQDPTIVAAENQAMLQAQVNSTTPIYYRRRPTNQDYKTGNLAQWVRNWGGSYNAMLVLDADSYMSAGAILTLANTLASNSHLGLVQGGLQIYQGKSHFARLQQFSSMAFGALPARGLAFWSGSEGNFFGHNAIIRTNAFAACAGLPTLRTRSQQQIPIFSHDFVEAALIRRAGWGVRILPNLENSFEECPETLVDYIQRDRRWCHGNMQHLRILGTKGLHPISRFHLFHNALGYLMSPAWFALWKR